MKYLLDTHVIMWSLIGDKRIDTKIRKIIENPNNEIYYSTASAWEIEIKHLKKENFKLSAEQFTFLCDQNGLENINIKNKHILELNNITSISEHNDPFDKILLAQAISENMLFITHDNKFKFYSNPNIIVF